VILATVSSRPGFHTDVRAALDGRIRVETAWDLDLEALPASAASRASRSAL
jgi:hypothetical protein